MSIRNYTIYILPSIICIITKDKSCFEEFEDIEQKSPSLLGLM